MQTMGSGGRVEPVSRYMNFTIAAALGFLVTISSLQSTHGEKQEKQDQERAEVLARLPRIPKAVFRIPAVSNEESFLFNDELSTQTQSIIESFEFLANSSSTVPYYAVSVVHEGEVLFTSGLSTMPFLLDRSISEIFKSLAILSRINSHNQISWDDPIGTFLPSFPDVDPNLSPDISLREYCGNPDGPSASLYKGDMEAGKKDDRRSVLERIRAQFRSYHVMWENEHEGPLAALDHERPPFPAIVAAFLSQAIADNSLLPDKLWQDFVQEEFLGKADMSTTGTDLSSAYDKWLHGKFDGIQNLFDLRLSEPAGGWYSTAMDLAKFLIDILKAERSVKWDHSSREWTVSWPIYGREPGSGIGLTWEDEKLSSMTSGIHDEHIITKGGTLGNFQSFVGLHPRTKLGVSVLILGSEFQNTKLDAKALGNEILTALIPPFSKLLDAHHAGLYLCKSAPPLSRKFNQEYSDTVEVFGGEVTISSSPSLGLKASLTVKLIVNEEPIYRQGQFLLRRIPHSWSLFEITDPPEVRNNKGEHDGLLGITFDFQSEDDGFQLNKAEKSLPGHVICTRQSQAVI